MNEDADLRRKIDRLTREVRWRVDVVLTPERFVDWEPTALARATGYVVSVDAEGRASSVPAAPPAVISAAQEAWARRRPDLAAKYKP